MANVTILTTIEKLFKLTTTLSVMEHGALTNISKILNQHFNVSFLYNIYLFNVKVNKTKCSNFTNINQTRNSILKNGTNCIKQRVDSTRKYLLYRINL